MTSVELEALATMSGEEQRAWLRALCAIEGQRPIGSIAQCLTIDSMVEPAIEALAERAEKWPFHVAREIALKAEPGKLTWTLGIPVLRKIPAEPRKRAIDAVAKISCSEEPRRWENRMKKVRASVANT